MNVLVIGSGGREHALVWKIRQSSLVEKIYCAPGNAGISKIAECIPIKPTDIEALLGFVQEKDIYLTVVGPEQPLAEGIVDRFRSTGQMIFGPTREAAELEWSKGFAKNFMKRHGIPTAGYEVFEFSKKRAAKDYLDTMNGLCVLKADGLAAGKGVVICRERNEATRILDTMFDGSSFGEAGKSVVIEEFMEGEEASIFVLTDGQHYVTLAPAQDHKRVFDNDEGKNTGGMGAHAPAPVVTAKLLAVIQNQIIEPTIHGMREEGRLYTGCLYVGIMVTSEGPKVVEYNCRFGDPETQVVLPLLNGDLVDLLLKTCKGTLGHNLAMDIEGAAVCVVVASGGYPDRYETGKQITGVDEAEMLSQVFHAGTRLENGHLVSDGGRVLGVTSIDGDGNLKEAVSKVYEAISRIQFDGMHYRRDIARRAIG